MSNIGPTIANIARFGEFNRNEIRFGERVGANGFDWRFLAKNVESCPTDNVSCFGRGAGIDIGTACSAATAPEMR